MRVQEQVARALVTAGYLTDADTDAPSELLADAKDNPAGVQESL